MYFCGWKKEHVEAKNVLCHATVNVWVLTEYSKVNHISNVGAFSFIFFSRIPIWHSFLSAFMGQIDHHTIIKHSSEIKYREKWGSRNFILTKFFKNPKLDRWFSGSRTHTNQPDILISQWPKMGLNGSTLFNVQIKLESVLEDKK